MAKYLLLKHYRGAPAAQSAPLGGAVEDGTELGDQVLGLRERAVGHRRVSTAREY